MSFSDKSFKEIAKYCKKETKRLQHQCLINLSETTKESKKLKKYKITYFEVNNLNVATALFLIPRIAYIRDFGLFIPKSILEFDEQGSPIEGSDKCWEIILNTMIDGLYCYSNIPDPEYWSKKEKKLMKKTKEYFTKYFNDLYL